MSDITPPSDLDRFRALAEHFPGLTTAMCARAGLNRAQVKKGLHEKTIFIANDQDGCEVLAGRSGRPLVKNAI